MRVQSKSPILATLGAVALVAVIFVGTSSRGQAAAGRATSMVVSGPDVPVEANAQQMIVQGRKTFRFDTFGDEVF